MSGCGGCGDAVRTVAHGAAGLVKAGLQVAGVPVDRVSDVELLRRRDACRQCPHATRNPERLNRTTRGLTTLSKCKLCGCLIGAKTRLASERCPDKPARW